MTKIQEEIASIWKELYILKNNSDPHSAIHLIIMNCECAVEAAGTDEEKLEIYRRFLDEVQDTYSEEAEEWNRTAYPECKGY